MTLEKQLVDGVLEIFRDGGIAPSKNPRFRRNDQQIDYAIRVARGLARYEEADGQTSINLLQAATGLGKTIGYLVPTMLYSALTGKRVAVSTFTRYLQQQILGNDAMVVASWVAELTGRDVSMARRVGRGNYVSVSDCTELLDALRLEGERRHTTGIRFLEELIDWASIEDNSGVLDDFLEPRDVAALPDGLFRQQLCLRSGSDEASCRAYQRDVDRSKAADVLVVNHALMVMHAYRGRSMLDGEGERPISAAVFDEADRLPDAAESVLSVGLPLHKMQAIVRRVSGGLGLQGVSKLVDRLYDAATNEKDIPASRMRVIVQGSAIERLLSDSADAMSSAARVLLASGAAMNGDVQRRDAINDFVDVARDFLRVRDAMRSSENEAMISWSPVRSYPQIMTGRADAARVLSRLWSVPGEKAPPGKAGGEEDDLEPVAYLDAVLFTSATLIPPGRRLPEAFDPFCNEVGVFRLPRRKKTSDGRLAVGEDGGPVYDGEPIHKVCLDLLYSYQPTKFGHLEFVLADPNAPRPTVAVDDEGDVVAATSPEWLAYCAMMVRAAHAAGGRTLVLATSWRDTAALKTLLADVPSLVVHKRGDPLRGWLSQYKETKGAILVTPGGWEGVDLPGLVNNLVVTRIPFLPPDSIDDDRRRLHMLARGMDPKKAENVLHSRRNGETRRKLEQGIGRAVRAPDDRSTVWIADPRFPVPGCHDESLDAVLMSSAGRRTFPSMRECIPARFMPAYERAKLLLLDGSLHVIES